MRGSSGRGYLDESEIQARFRQANRDAEFTDELAIRHTERDSRVLAGEEIDGRNEWLEYYRRDAITAVPSG